MSVLEIVTFALILLFGLLGFISGIVTKIGALAALAAGIIVAYFLATPLNNFIAETEFFTETMCGWFDGNTDTASLVLLICCYVIVFIVAYIVISIIFKGIKALIEKVGFLKFIDRILGLAFGAAFGIVLGAVILFIVSFIGENGSEEIAAWLIEDIEKGFGLIQWMNEYLVPSAYQLVTDGIGAVAEISLIA